FKPDQLVFDPDLRILSANNKVEQLAEIFRDDENLKIFPNPSSSELLIYGSNSMKEFHSIEIFDMQSKLIRRMPFNHRISLADLPPAVYILQLIAKDKISRHKIIKVEF